MQTSRLFEIVYLLLAREQMTAAELAAHFEVSTRTIYRDIDALSASGIPIVTAKGKGGGIRLLERFVLGRSLLSEQEQEGILAALQGLEAVGAGGGRTGELISKLTAIFQKESQDWIHIDFSDWGGNQGRTFATLRAAILGRREVSFPYYNSKGESALRVVQPLQLWFRHRAWYLRAHCLDRNEERTFRLSRMRAVEMSHRTFERPPESASLHFEQPPAELLHLTLRIHPSQTYRVLDEFDPDRVRRDEEGCFLVEATYPEGEWVYGFLLSFSHHLEVLEPTAVRDELRRRAALMLENFSRPI